MAVLALAGCGSSDSDSDLNLIDVQETTELNDSYLEAQTVEMGSRISGHLGGNDQIDYYSVAVPAAGTLEIRLSGDSGTDFDLVLRDSTSSFLEGSGNDFSDESISYLFGSAQNVYLAVSSYAEAGNYSLSIYGEFSDSENSSLSNSTYFAVSGGACIEVPGDVALATQDNPYSLGSCSDSGLNFVGSCTNGPSTVYYTSGSEAVCEP